MNIALLQLNLVVGDIGGNAAKIFDGVQRAMAEGADLCVTSELALTGYPPRDLLLEKAFVRRTWEQLEQLARELKDAPPVLVGTPEANDTGVGKPLFNCAALLLGGEVRARFHKSLLPTYDVFDEDRYFQPGQCPGFIELKGHKIGVTICEDIWNDKGFWKQPLYVTDPVEKLLELGVDVLVNLSASPFSMGKQCFRQEMLGALAKKSGAYILYCNQIGGNDDLVFAGQSMACAPDGSLFARAESFGEDVLLADLETRSGRLEPDPAQAEAFGPEAEAWGALVLGTRDYVKKCGFNTAILGLSGGVDSSLTAAIAAEALGARRVTGVMMPSRFSSRGSLDDSADLAERLGVATLTIPIWDIMGAFDEALEDAFAGRERDVTEENLQARIRGNLLMAMSNKFGAMLLSTGNKSEMSVGYSTIYGDMSGGLAVISDVPKTLVYRLARYVNETRGEIIPEAVLTKAPSAELRPDQTDQDSLPPYDLLDEILKLMVEGMCSPGEIVAKGFDREVVDKVARLVRSAEFKRRQAPPGVKITDRAFGTGWRMAIASRPPRDY